MATREEVVREARTWIHTPYQHQARLRGVAVDCAGLVIGVARAVGIVEPGFDVNGYSAQPDGVSLMEHSCRWMSRIQVEMIQAGDVIVTRFDEDPCHFAIVANYYTGGGLSMIHALRVRGGGGRVIEHRLDPSNLRKVVAAFELPGIS